MYQEFKKEMTEGDKTIKRTYIRTQCKNCNAIIEYDKRRRKTHKGYCAKCRNVPREGFLLTKDDVIYESNGFRCRGIKIICEKCGSEYITTKQRAKANKFRLCRECVSHLTIKDKPRFHSVEEIKKFIKDNVTINEHGCWIWKNGKGVSDYGHVNINAKRWQVHRLSYSVFIGPIPEGKVACHRCDEKMCCNPEHIFLGTHQDNSSDMVNKDRQARGSKSAKAKLTEKDVIKIKEMIREGFGNTEIANYFDVGPKNICEIRRGSTWKHVAPSPTFPGELLGNSEQLAAAGGSQ